MIALMTTVFIASLVGSLHCAGMCGGLVTLCISGERIAPRREWLPHVQYNLGRLVAYAALGTVSGAAGAALDLGGSAFGWTRAAMAVAGVTMVIAGAVALIRARGCRLGRIHLPSILERPAARAIGAARRLPASVRPIMIGLLTACLPCGWLYAFVVSAAGTGSPALGALVMTAFWAGTVPTMLALGVSIERLSGALRRHVPTLTACALIAVGIVTIFGRLSVPAIAAPDSPTTPNDAIQYVESIDHRELPCCDDT